jgi:hypothetical protein
MVASLEADDVLQRRVDRRCGRLDKPLDTAYAWERVSGLVISGRGWYYPGVPLGQPRLRFPDARWRPGIFVCAADSLRTAFSFIAAD